MTRRIVATFPDGSQTLVTEWDSGEIKAARRTSRSLLWGPPTSDVRIEDELGGDAA